MKGKIQRIGICDSGFGGLSVLSTLIKAFPSYEYIYLGDSARAPYGDRDKKTLQNYGLQCAHFLQEQQVEHIVIACNTLCATALPRLKKEISLPLHGMTDGFLDYFPVSSAHSLTLLATRATVESGMYRILCQSAKPDVPWAECACPEWAPLIERGNLQGQQLQSAILETLSDWQTNPPSHAILGCTHYPLIQRLLQSLFPNVTFWDPAYSLVERLQKEGLSSAHAASMPSRTSIHLFTTGSTQHFSTFFRQVFPHAEDESLGWDCRTVSLPH